MIPIKFCANIFFWMFSRVDHKYVTDVGLIDSFLANPSLLKNSRDDMCLTYLRLFLVKLYFCVPTRVAINIYKKNIPAQPSPLEMLKTVGSLAGQN